MRRRTPSTPRRRLAAAGLLVPAALLIAVCVYAVLGAFESRCTTFGDTRAAGGVPSACAGSDSGVALVAFPAAVICLVIGVAVLRGVPWARWVSVVVSAILATVVAASTLAGIVALAGDSGDAGGAAAVGFGGLALSAVCALPAVLLSGARAAADFSQRGD